MIETKDDELRFEYRAMAGSQVLHIFDVVYGERAEKPICNIKVTRPLTFLVQAPEDIEARAHLQNVSEKKNIIEVKQ